jgi:peroxiredoxin
LYVFISLLSFLSLFSCNSNNSGTNITAQIGDIAPDFTLKDISGNTIKLSDYNNNVVLLEFWATWCPPCKASIPELTEINAKYKTRGFTVIGVSVDNMQDLPEHLTEFSRSYHINYPVLLGDEDVAVKYNIKSIPVMYLIDKQGKIVNTYSGFSDNLGNEISAQIEKII